MIEIKNISKTYQPDKVPVRALRGVSLKIETGEFVAIVGPSGSGKSTLLHILGFLDRPDAGSYRIFDTETSGLADTELAALRNGLAGFVFQQFHLLRRVSALENTELPLIYAGKKKDVARKAYEKLEAVGLAERQKHRPSELSGGEQQRVAIARSLVNNPMIIFADEPTGNLDTHSEEEIMKILRKLNEEGKTIIMVTHEREIASQAKRIITMRDGKIQSDVYRDKGSPKPAVEADKSLIQNIISQRHSSFGRMEFLQHCRQSFQAILSNKVRSFLSILGILFGVGAVIAMMALGEGAKVSMEQRLKSLGSNLLSIRGGHSMFRGASTGAGTVARFTFEDVDMIKNSPYIKRAGGSSRGSAQVVYENENWSTTVEGVGYDYGAMRATLPEIGRWFTKEEISRRDKVAILGLTVVEKIFGSQNPIGKEIKINRINFNVIGIAPEKGSGGWHDQDDVVYIPLTTAMYRVLGKDYVDQIYAEVADVSLMETAKEDISNLIKKRHKLYQSEDSFEIRDMSEIQEMLSSTTRTMSLLLGSIAAISLLVGGIGIMNIMLVSVTERTREIGLRKAVGARRVDIMSQFLIEAVVMTFSGGLMGIFLGTAAAVIMAAVFGWATKVSLFSIVLSTTFSIAVGIGFGLWPARKAAYLNPIEALRYE